ncbi:excalibur calcium-binding domain-containing protein [Sphingopyxis fribergensis]|uniref:excalibur calcium-binding domain-containing protein n=1 Tax=Sphingopyxis fribergensis TaxID=1515612 RepID=UPI0009DF2EEA|nr:excalibur calcium-binding domain-containing protein [Sphingopyxis fribergensis]
MARRWNHRRANRAGVSSTHILLGAGVIGALAGIGSIGATSEGRAHLYDVASEASVAAGLARERAPAGGDYWRRCDDARAAGTAPIYRGEPGYRDGLDADNDGIACEPYRGQ